MYHRGMFGGGGGGSGSSIQSLLTQLQNITNKDSATFDPFMESAHVQLDLLSQICEKLSFVQNEGELSGLRVSELCRTLVTLLPDQSDTPDIMRQLTFMSLQRSKVLSARAMCNLMEALPGSASLLVDSPGCVDQLLEKLMNISYIDVAEQSVLALQKMSRERAPSLLKAGGLAAILSFIDFFPALLQRTCLQTAANLVVRIPPESMDLALQAIPLVLQKLASKQGLDEAVHSAIILFLVRVTHNVTASGSAMAMQQERAMWMHSGGGAGGGSSGSGGPSVPPLTPAQVMSRVEQSGMVRAVVDLLRHALAEPSLFPSSAMASLLSILVSLSRKSAKISQELLDERNIVPLLVQIYAHITGSSSGGDAKTSTSLQLPSSSPPLTASPSVRASQAGGSASAGASQLNPLLSLAIELLPDLRSSRTSTFPTQANAAGDPAASARQLFSELQSASSRGTTANAVAASGSPAPSATSAPRAIPTPAAAAAAAASSSDRAGSDSVGQRLTFLSPVAEPALSSSPPSASLLDDAAVEQMDAEDEALDRAEQVRLDRAADEDSDVSPEPEEPPRSKPTPSAAAPSTPAASAGAASAAASSTEAAPAPASSPFKSSLHEDKAAFLIKHPALLQSYIRSLLPLFIQAALSSNDNHLRYKCVSGVLRICCVVESAWLVDSSLFPLAQLSNFVHNMLSTADPAIVAAALQLIDLLMLKGADVYGPQLFREGCIETVQDIADNGLAQSAHKSQNEAAASAAAAAAAAASSPSASALPAVLTVQQRAKQLIQKHFGDEGEEEEEEAAGEADAEAVTALETSMMGDEGGGTDLRAATPTSKSLHASAYSPSLSPSKRRRRFSSCATPIFKRAQQLTIESRSLLEQHGKICRQLHEQAANSTEVAALTSTLEQTENSLLLCLSAVCSCLVGTAGVAVLPAPSAALPSPLTPTSPAGAASAGDTLTVHEFLNSGLLDSLLALLFDPSTAAKFSAAADGSSTALADVWKADWSGNEVVEELALQRRQRLFAHVFFGLPRRAVPTDTPPAADAGPAAPSIDARPGGAHGDTIGDLLLRKLIEALESIDPFQTRTCGVGAAQALRMFSQPFRVRLTYRPQMNLNADGTLMMAAAAENAGSKTAATDGKMETSDDSSSGASPAAAAAAAAPSPAKASSSKSDESSPASAPRRTTRSSARAEVEEAKSFKSRPASKSPAPRKTGFAASISNAVSALKKKVGRSPSLSPAEAAAAAAAAAATAAAAAKAAAAAALAAALPQLYQSRTVMIDTLADFRSIELFLQETTSMFDLMDRTQRVQKGLSPYKSPEDYAAEEQLLAAKPAAGDAAAAASSASASRSGSRKKKGGAAAAESVASPPSEEEQTAAEHARLLEAIRQAQENAAPVRLSFRFAKRPSQPQPSPYQSYSAGLFALGGRAPPRKPEESKEEEDNEWIEIGADRQLSLFEAVQLYHPNGYHRRLRDSASGGKNASASAVAAPSSAAAAASARPWSAFEMFNTVYEIEFRLVRESADSKSKASNAPAGSKSTDAALKSAPAATKATDADGDAVSAGDASPSGSKLSPSQSAAARLAERIQSALPSGSGKSTTTVASMLLLLDSLHHLSHHWAVLYSSWPDMVQMFTDNDSAGNGTTGRSLTLPASVLAAGGATHLQLPSSHSFSSTKLSRKLQLQCEDPVIVVGGLLPPWVDLLTLHVPYLFHFSARELLFRVTAFQHPSRHLLSLHNHLTQTQGALMAQLNGRGGGGGGGGGGIRSDAGMLDEAASSDEEGGDMPRRVGGGGGGGASGGIELANRHRSMMQHEGEESTLSPVDRIVALKVHVRRDNVLSSAKQLFMQHPATRRGTIRAEFQGEEAVGVGPTLEFFTLVSQQLQLKRLHIWNKPELKLSGKVLPSASPTIAVVEEESKEEEPQSAAAAAAGSDVEMGHADAKEPSDNAQAMDLDDEAASHKAAEQQPQPSSAAASADSAATEDTPTSRKGKAVAKRKRQNSVVDASQPASAAASERAPGKRAKNDSPASSPPDASAAETTAAVAAPSVAPFVPLRGSTQPPPLPHSSTERLHEFFEFGVIQCPLCKVVEAPYCHVHNQFLTVRERDGSWRCAGPLEPVAAEAESAAPKRKAKSHKKKARGRRLAKAEEEEEEGEEEAAPAAPAAAAAAAAPSSSAKSAPARIPCLTSTNTISAHCTFCAELAQKSAAGSFSGAGASAAATSASPSRRQLKHWRVHTDELDYVREAFPKGALLHSHMLLQCTTCLCVNFPGTSASPYGSASQASLLASNRGGQMVNKANAVLSEKSYRSVTRHVTHVCDLTPLHMLPAVLLRHTLLDVIDLCKANSPRLDKPTPPSSSNRGDKATGDKSAATPSAAKTAMDAEPKSESKSESAEEAEEEEKESTRTPVKAPAEPAASPTAPSSSPAATATAAPDSDEPESEFVSSSSLYPPAMLQRVSSDPSREAGVPVSSLEWLWLLGRFLGQSLMEQRLLDLPFSMTLLRQLTAKWHARRNYSTALICRWAAGEIAVPSVTHQAAPATLVEQSAQIPPPPPSVILALLMDILELSPHLARPMLKMLALSYHRFSPLLFPLPSSLQSLDGARIEDLGFDFTLPGSPEIELVPGGSDLSVTDGNAHVWLWLVSRQILCEGVVIQLRCMQQGLRICLDTDKLQPFYPHELEELVSGGGSSGSKPVAWDWSIPRLRSAIRFGRGYQPDSPAIGFLLQIMSQFTPAQQRQFTRFITGSPSLPGGQISALNPPLVIVKIDLAREESAQTAINLTDSPALTPAPSPADVAAVAAASAQNYVLPSVMTCTHYLKLPNYPTLEIMREKLMIAITEGSTGFTLS